MKNIRILLWTILFVSFVIMIVYLITYINLKISLKYEIQDAKIILGEKKEIIEREKVLIREIYKSKMLIIISFFVFIGSILTIKKI